ncbi:ribosomal-processing cysteine protease Prp [Sedimentibacter sp. zth1]|uniref:ribosomal-processing cysteine protease Prp n=1 Tax=Sedimentibacter sp. zth1 TaxID=2816908 RepID=UPI001A923714|nr:ribosomal-processing cysteine protease Prp [Sedimentibacter sp. zth1]QSX06354.1 ribosomal-processing cysteine protease Prp [Sedimentibacter sp. zth1]
MTRVTIHKTNDRIVGFIIDGHTGFANSGEDIVCASVSLLATTVINSLNIVAKIDEKDINFYIDEELGFLSLDTKNSINDKSDVIYNTFLVGIQLLIQDYSDYITLKLEEV